MKTHRALLCMVLCFTTSLPALTDDSTPNEWGARWQPKLPARERHPFLFYDETDRQRMQERRQQSPWKEWWRALPRAGLRSTPAVVWWLTGDEDAARKARTDLLTHPIWREPTHGYLEPSSHRFADYLAAYDVLAAWSGLSAEDRRTIRRRIAAEAVHYYQVLAGVPGGANYGNQRTLAASALGMAALVLCEYTGTPPGPREWIRRALHEIRRPENFWFFRPGGRFVEGCGYTTYMNLQFVPFVIAYERAVGVYLFDDPRLRQWLVFAAYQMLPNGEYVMRGTCESGVGMGFFGLLSNHRYGGELAPLFHHAFNLPSPPRLDSCHVHIALARYDPNVSGPLPPASRAFPLSQTVVLRQDWSPAAVSVWFAGKDGAWPVHFRYQTYSHADAGHFVLAAWNEILAADSGYDHWKSRDYYGARFHNVLLVDDQGPGQDTPGALTDVCTEGPVRRAAVTCRYGQCTLRRTLALVRGRYVLVVDRVMAAGEHEYTWQVRSTCPPGASGTTSDKRQVTWPGLSAAQWRDLKPGRTQLTIVAPPFAAVSLQTGRWRPISWRPEFHNQVVLAKWRARSCAALFALIPNLRDHPDVIWRPLAGQNMEIRGPGWTDRVVLDGETLTISDAAGQVLGRFGL